MIIIFILIVLFLTALLMKKPRKVFIFLLGMPIMFFVWFHIELLFTIGSIKIYPQDIVMASLFIFILFNFPKVIRQKSTQLFLLLYIWGIIAIIRGITTYGYSSIGEARWYTLPIHYYIFIIIVFDTNEQIISLLKWCQYFIYIMFIKKSIYLLCTLHIFSLTIFMRALNSSDTLLISFLCISSFLMLISAKKRCIIILINFILSLFFIILIQVRSVWVSTLGCFIAICRISGRKSSKILLYFLLASFLFLFMWLTIENSSKNNIISSFIRQSTFLKNAEKDDTAAWRFAGWRQRINQAMEQPIFGEGLGGYSNWEIGGEISRTAVHNDYIMYFAKFGFTGILLLFLGLFYWYRELNKYIKNEFDVNYKLLAYNIKFLILGHLIYAFFYSFTTYFWILLGIGTVILKQHNTTFNYTSETNNIR